MHESNDKPELPAEAQVATDHTTSAENDSPTVPIVYFGISLTRLVSLSILTLGLYRTYWFYRNWKAIKKAENRNIWPFWRAIFAVFFLHSLFEKISLSAKSNGYQRLSSHRLLATGYIILLIVLAPLAKLIDRAEIREWKNIILSLSLLVPFPLLLWPIQKAINFNNAKLIPNYRPIKTFALGEIIIILIGLASLSLTIVNAFSQSQIKAHTTNTTTWKVFKAPAGDFEVSFPTHPTQEKEELPIADTDWKAKFESYESEAGNGMAYSISKVTYPPAIDLAEIELDEFVEDMVSSSSGNKLVSSKLTYFDNHRAVDYLIRTILGYLKGKLIVVGQTKYLLMVSYATEDYDEEQYNQFIQSFTFTL